MKRPATLFFIIFLLLLGQLYGQSQRLLQQQAKITVSEGNDDLLIYKRYFTDEEISHLLRTKTVFLYPDTIASQLDLFKQAVSSAWTLTPLVFDSYRNASKYVSDTSYSVFRIWAGGFRRYATERNVGNTLSTSVLSLVHCYFSLFTTRWYTDANGKERSTGNAFCRIELYPSELTSDMTEVYQNDKLLEGLNTKGFFNNLKPVQLAAHLRVVANDITRRMRPYLYADTTAPELNKLLPSDTLYIPKSIMIHMRIFGGKQSPMKDDMFRKYPYPYKICSDAELYTIFETEKRGRLLFEYTKSVSDKFVTIVDVKNGNLLYKKYTSGFNLKDDDIKEIVSAASNKGK